MNDHRFYIIAEIVANTDRKTDIYNAAVKALAESGIVAQIMDLRVTKEAE